MTTPKASGPLWMDIRTLDHIDDRAVIGVSQGKLQTDDVPCRLIPGHGKMVPVELVEAIENAFVRDGPPYSDKYNKTLAAIDAAIRGAI
jgi:hypothetical protein